MEETTSTSTPSKGGSNKFIMPVAIVVIIAIAAIGYYAFQSQKKASTSATPTPMTNQMETTQAPTSQYKDGTYQVVGSYVSPGGPREVDVTVTLAGDTITDVTFVGKATDATSKRFQQEFADGFEPMVVGKNINEVTLTKVSGSSLTPKGFNDAIEKIKAEAQG